MTSDSASSGGEQNLRRPPDPFAYAVDRVVAEAEIRNLAAQFSDAVNYNDPDAFAALWDADAVWEIGEPYVSRASGRAEIVALLHRLREQWAFFVQLTHNGVIEFASGTVATTRWSVREVARSPDGAQSYDNLGTYVDSVKRVEGVWRFVSRSYQYIWLSETPLLGRSFPLPAPSHPITRGANAMSDAPLDYNALMQANLTRVFGERDASRRLKAIGQLYAPDATLYEPDAEAKGHVAINEAVEALHLHLPHNFAFSANGPAVGHHGIGRLRWQSGPPNGPVAVSGTDVAHFENGRIHSLYVFLDPAP
jgi:ketosteroid isomerase-like protein